MSLLLVEPAKGYISANGPAPRFDGARDWSTIYSLDSLSNTLPCNDDPAGTGQLWLKNTQTGAWDWTDPGLAGFRMP